MKIAIPTREGVVDGHFGHCEFFTILTVDESRAIVQEEQLTPPPGCGCKSDISPVLADMGVTVLLAGNMGQGAVDKLQGAGINVTRGAAGPVRTVAETWLAGDLITSNEICSHHGHEGCGHH